MFIDRPEKFREERNDCTVIALSKGFNIPYEEAHNYLSSLGRKKGKGFKLCAYLLTLSYQKQKLFNREINGKYFENKPTLYHFIKQNPDKKFIIRVNHHALVVNKGKILDSRLGLKRKVIIAIEIKENEIDSIENKILKILENGSLTYEQFIKEVLKDEKVIQPILRLIYKLKEEKKIINYNLTGVIWVKKG